MLENPQTERVATTENPFTPPTEGQASVGMQENDPSQAYDFTYVPTIARIALYDDLRSAPPHHRDTAGDHRRVHRKPRVEDLRTGQSSPEEPFPTRSSGK